MAISVIDWNKELCQAAVDEKVGIAVATLIESKGRGTYITVIQPGASVKPHYRCKGSEEYHIIGGKGVIRLVPANAKQIANAIQQHWGIENKLHWVLDVCFSDDQSRTRKGNAPRNIAIIKKTTLNLMQIVKPHYPRISLKRMRKLAGWDDEFLETVLRAEF